MASPWSHVSPLKHSQKFVELDVLGRQHNNGTSHSRDPIAFIPATLSQHSPLSKHLMEFVCGMPWSDHLASSHLASPLLQCPPPSFPITALPYTVLPLPSPSWSYSTAPPPPVCPPSTFPTTGFPTVLQPLTCPPLSPPPPHTISGV
ncbi:hypothetical protein Pcinc_022230 [Petrolisthes cinctipes]|uniref:Uncharacterized protein n=1 Tax=Petrolisthes cinctipes TaxID=88211 RepID=A0AAE1FI68_PETCI|nr:hypothetical protein Pcinc_022230 [Petrolisthes cinctipes]